MKAVDDCINCKKMWREYGGSLKKKGFLLN